MTANRLESQQRMQEADDARFQKNQAFDVELNERWQKQRALARQTTGTLLTASSKADDGSTIEERRARLQREVKLNRATTKKMHRGTINPNSFFMRYWDIALIVALMVTAMLTPLEVAFMDSKLDDLSSIVIMVISRATDAVFVVDIAITFFVPIRLAKKGGMITYNNSVIATEYLRGWFAPDVFSVIPFDLIVGHIVDGTGSELDVSVLRVLRIVKLFKLVRITRGSRVLSRWQDYIGLSFTSITLIQFSVLTIMMSHWLACLWGFMADPTIDRSWDGVGSGVTWCQRMGLPPEITAPELYVISLYTALNNIFGSEPQVVYPANYNEYVVQSLMLLIGSSIWAYIIGSACGILATNDPSKLEFRTTFDELNYVCCLSSLAIQPPRAHAPASDLATFPCAQFAKDQMLPNELTVQLRAYFRNMMHVIRSNQYFRLLNKMSTRLRGDAAFQQSRHRLRQVHYLVNPKIEPEFLCNLAIEFRTRVYSNLERVPCSELFVVESGVVAKRGRLVMAGGCFGMDVILSNDNLRDLGDGIALTFVQTYALTQASIFGLLPDYPGAFVVVRRAALRMALVRALARAARLLKSDGRYMVKRSLIEVFDKAMSQAVDEAEEARKQEEAKHAVIPLSHSANKALLALTESSFKPKPKLTLKGKWGTVANNIKDASFMNGRTNGNSERGENGSSSSPVGITQRANCQRAKWNSAKYNLRKGLDVGNRMKTSLAPPKPKTFADQVTDLKERINAWEQSELAADQRVNNMITNLERHLRTVMATASKLSKSRRNDGTPGQVVLAKRPMGHVNVTAHMPVPDLPVPKQAKPLPVELVVTPMDCSAQGLLQLPPIPPQTPSLNCSSNKLTALPPSIGKLVALATLDASVNQLTALPVELADCQALKNLLLFANKLKELPPRLPPKLTELNLFNNQLKKLPSAIGELCDLQEVNLAANKLMLTTDAHFASWRLVTVVNLYDNNLVRMGSLAPLASLVELRLSGNNLEAMPTLSHHPALTILELHKNRISKIDDSYFEAMPALQRLSLWGNQLAALPSSLCTCLQLLGLQVQQNQLSDLPHGAYPPQLETLFLQQNPLATLPSALADCMTLRRVNIGGTQLDAVGRQVADSIKRSCLAQDGGIFWAPTGEVHKAPMSML